MSLRRGSLREPPSDVPPERLFRSLLRTPRAVTPIAYRIRGMEGVPLRVQALRSLEESDAFDLAADIDSPEARDSVAMAHIVAAAVLAPSGPLFADADEVGMLAESEFEDLASAVLAGLSRISPSWRWSDWQAWLAVLERGARHPSNMGEAVAIGYADLDRYFGLPICQVTDGQRMVVRVCRDIVSKMK